MTATLANLARPSKPADPPGPGPVPDRRRHPAAATRGRPRRRRRAPSARRSTTARRWASSTLPPYLNLADTDSTAMLMPRMAASFAGGPRRVGHGDVGLERQLAAQDGGHAARARALVVDRRRAGQLHGGVVGGGDAERRVLVADGLPGRRDEGPVPGHAQEDRVGSRPGRRRSGWRAPGAARPCRLEHELGRHDDGHVASAAGGDQVAELVASTKGRHSASPRVASTGAMYMPSGVAQVAIQAAEPSSSIDSARWRL
jgi:hypothetical protein